MLRKFLLVSLLTMLLVSTSLAQETLGPRIEITGINPVLLPRVGVMVNAFDDFGQPLPDLAPADFRVVGELAEHARVTDVVSFSDPLSVPISVVLAIDVSTSMAGTPIQKAKEAAAAFVNAMADDDPVAVLTFSSAINLVQDFTIRRDILLESIDGLLHGGQTLLYDAVLQSITLAAEANNPRRAVILLSDGAHYDERGRSTAMREDVRQAAIINGVPIYTIGLGFGADRSYLERLSEETNAFFRESPTPAELREIYSSFADLLRTQYDVTLDVDVPLDGRIWTLELEVDTPWGPVRATGNLRAPVPIPIFNFPPLPQPVLEPVEIVADIVADDGVAEVTVSLDDADPVPVSGPPFTFQVDPVALSPGEHSLQFTATDREGDSGSATLEFSVGALPPEVSIEPEPGRELEEERTFTLTVGGQTSLAEASWRLDDGAPAPLGPQLSFTIDPNTLPPGEHRLQLEVSNIGGETVTPGYFFTVPPLPIRIEIEGLTEGEVLEDSADVSVSVQSSQLPVTDIEYTLNDVPLPDVDDRITLEAAALEPGDATLGVSVRNAGGQVETASLEFEVAQLPVEIDLEGLAPDSLVDRDLDLTIDVSGQGSGFQVEALLDGEPVLLQEGSARVGILDLAPGEHTLVITARDEYGNVGEESYSFNVSPGPAQTATQAVAVRRATAAAQAATAVQVNRARLAATVAMRQQLTATQAAVEQRATSVARSTEFAARNRARVSATVAARATATQVAGEQMATAAAESTATAQADATRAAAQRHATVAARSTTSAQRNRERITATLAARATTTQVAIEQGATAAAGATATQVVVESRATSAAQATATQVATQQIATATSAAQATSTQVVAERRATVAAGATATQAATQRIATATRAAEATATQVATQRIATATRAAEATATQVTTQRIATATSAARATATQVATQRIATATSAAQATSTQVVAERRATVAAGATATQVATQRIATATGAAQATATRAAEATATQVATQRIATATSAAQATATQVATQRIATATSAAQATATQVATQRIATATRAAEATATQVATQRIATATSAAQATATQVATQRIATATSAAQATATQVATQRIATATSAAQATATQVATQRIATATSAAQATATQVATQQIATATSAAQATATQAMVERNATAAALATRRAERNRMRIAATQAARQQQTATQAAEDRSATLEAVVDAAALLNRQVRATATQRVVATESVRQLTATAVARATLSMQATQTTAAQATTDARATSSALAATEAVAMATYDAQATQEVIAATQRMLEIRSGRATATAQADIDATATARAASLLAALATESALATEAAQVTPTSTLTPVPTEVEPSATPTTETPVASITPAGTLVPAQAETTPAEGLITPVVVLCAALGLVGLLGLLLIFSLLRGARRRR